MAVKIFSYNPTQAVISGVTNIGTLAIGTGNLYWADNPGGLTWWMGPDESLGFVIGGVVTGYNQPTQVGSVGNVQFWRTQTFSDSEFLDLANYVKRQAGGAPDLMTASDAVVWLNANSYYTNWTQSTTTTTSTSTSTTTTTTTAAPTTTTSTSTSTTTTTTTLPAGTVTFSQTFTQSVAPSAAIQTAWDTFRSQLTGTYTTFSFFSNLNAGVTVTHPTNVQTLANALRNATNNTSVTINSVVWRVGTGCTNLSGITAVEFSNVGSCSPSSTYALRPRIGNANWGGVNGSTVGAATQTITLSFS